MLFFCCLSIHGMVAQTCCSAGAPITSSFDIGNAAHRGWGLQLDYEYKSVNRLVSDNEILLNDPRNRNGQNLLIKSDFVLNDKWAFSGFLPFVIQSRETFSENQSASGLGDLTLLGQYTQAIKTNSQLKIALGLKLPTGKQFHVDNRGVTLSPDMQSGSGTYDFIGRLAYTKAHAFVPNLNHQSSISYKYNTTNAHFGDPEKVNGRSFKFGNELLITTSFNYLVLLGTWFSTPEFGLQLRHTTPNYEQEKAAPNSGGWWWSIPLAWHFQPNEKSSIGFYGNIPIGQNLEGLQITTDYAVGIRLRYFFSKKNDQS